MVFIYGVNSIHPFETVVTSHEIFRNSLTWKSKPSSVIQKQQHSNNRRSSNVHDYDNHNYNYDNYDNYREASSSQHSRYFPSSTFTTHRDQEAYYQQPAEPVSLQPMRNKPSRNYFPVKHYTDDDSLDLIDNNQELPNTGSTITNL